jgi:hypothetical protein
MAKLTLLALVAMLAACPIANAAFTRFGAHCADDAACGAGFGCDADGRCVPHATVGEGEGSAGEGEGHSADGEGSSGEGEGSSGEGEGAGEGEGNVDATDGEGECPDFTACECPVGDGCYVGNCARPLGVCLTDDDCGSTQQCTAANSNNPGFGSCDFSGGVRPVCHGVSMQLSVALTWPNNSAELDLHVTKEDANGYCINAVTDANGAPFGPKSHACDPAPHDCETQLCNVAHDVGAAPSVWVPWGPNIDNIAGHVEIPANDTVSQPNEGFTGVRTAPAGDYLVAVYDFFDSNQETSFEVVIKDGTGQAFTVTSSVGTNTQEWRELAHVKVDASGAIACFADLTKPVTSCAP